MRVRAAIRADGLVTVRWNHDGSGPPENFVVQFQREGDLPEDWSVVDVVNYAEGQLSYSTTDSPGLEPGGPGVVYRVNARNVAGASAWVESNPVSIPVVVPNVPTDVTATL